MEIEKLLNLFLALLGLSTAGIWITIKAMWTRTDDNKREVDKNIASQAEVMSARLDAQYQALHDRLSVHHNRLHRFELHVAENYVKNEHLEKALSKTEATLIKEVHSVRDQMEQSNSHMAHLSKMLQAMAANRMIDPIQEPRK